MKSEDWKQVGFTSLAVAIGVFVAIIVAQRV